MQRVAKQQVIHRVFKPFFTTPQPTTITSTTSTSSTSIITTPSRHYHNASNPHQPNKQWQQQLQLEQRNDQLQCEAAEEVTPLINELFHSNNLLAYTHAHVRTQRFSPTDRSVAQVVQYDRLANSIKHSTQTVTASANMSLESFHHITKTTATQHYNPTMSTTNQKFQQLFGTIRNNAAADFHQHSQHYHTQPLHIESPAAHHKLKPEAQAQIQELVKHYETTSLEGTAMDIGQKVAKRGPRIKNMSQ